MKPDKFFIGEEKRPQQGNIVYKQFNWLPLRNVMMNVNMILCLNPFSKAVLQAGFIFFSPLKDVI